MFPPSRGAGEGAVSGRRGWCRWGCGRVSPAALPSTPDHLPVVHEALVEGYRAGGATAAVDRFREHRDAYRLLALVHGMVHFEDWVETEVASDERVEDAAAGHRSAVESLL